VNVGHSGLLRHVDIQGKTNDNVVPLKRRVRAPLRRA
jgi:hypothetical protein